MLSKLRKFKKLYTDTIVWICAGICLVILALNFYNVIARYALGGAFIYTEDVTVLGMLWIMGLGIGVGWINCEHLLINIIDGILKGKAFEILLFILDIIGMGAGFAMIYLGNITAQVNKGLTQSAVGFDESVRYWPVMVGGGLVIIAAVERIAEQIILWKGGNTQ